MSEHDNTDIPGVLIHPPLLFLILVIIGIALDAVWPVPLMPASMQIMGGGVLIVMAVSLLGSALVRFRRAETHVETWKPASALVTAGPYRATRNPIYIAYGLAFLGLACALDNIWLAGLTVVLMVFLDLVVVRREERYLAAKFGDDYRAYSGHVRRWL
ncbi:MAG: isoprenylcysteine carboxylmethyltransferase family protein [Pseudomonadota bacterium]